MHELSSYITNVDKFQIIWILLMEAYTQLFFFYSVEISEQICGRIRPWLKLGLSTYDHQAGVDRQRDFFLFNFLKYFVVSCVINARNQFLECWLSDHFNMVSDMCEKSVVRGRTMLHLRSWENQARMSSKLLLL